MPFLMDLFIPHHGNNHKAHLIRPYSLFLLSLVFLFFQVSLSFFSLARPSVLGFSADITPERIIELSNTERIRIKTEPLKENKLLSEAARQKAADMFAFNYWAHVSPSGRSPWAFFADVGYKYQYAGENLARDFGDPESVIKAWMNSPAHRDNVINSKYQEIGVAVVNGTLQGVETTLVVQLFGTPYGAVISKQIPAGTGNSQSTAASLTKTRQVLTKGFETKIPISNPLDLTKAMAVLVLGILIGVFVADVILVSHRNTPRLSSRSLAQMMFLLAVLLASFFIKKGAIL